MPGSLDTCAAARSAASGRQQGRGACVQPPAPHLAAGAQLLTGCPLLAAGSTPAGLQGGGGAADVSRQRTHSHPPAPGTAVNARPQALVVGAPAGQGRQELPPTFHLL
jgi:hypothetical protein